MAAPTRACVVCVRTERTTGGDENVAIVRPASGEVVFNSSVLTTEAEAIDSEAGTGHLRTAAVRTSERCLPPARPRDRKRTMSESIGA